MNKLRVFLLAGSAAVSIVVTALLFFLFSSAHAATGEAETFTWRDDFNSATLDSRWFWVREDPTHWSLTERPGFMRLTTQQGSLIGAGGDAPNLLLQGAPPATFTVETRLLFTPTANFQSAGLLLYEDDDNFMALSHSYCVFLPGCVGNGIYFGYEEDGAVVGTGFVATTTVPGEAYLRLERVGDVITGSFSVDGANWNIVGAYTVVTDFLPAGVGLGVETGYQDVTEIPADFDYFQLRDESLRLYLPTINKP